PLSAEPKGYGWWSFCVRMGYKVIRGLVSNQHVFRGEFLYVYNAEPDTWDFPLVPTLAEPKLHMNRQVDQMDDTEALVALYLRSRTVIESCGDVHILPMHWIPSREELKHEEFMCVVGLNHRYPKARTRLEDPMASHISKAQLLRAQLQDKIASGALKVPKPPGDPKKAQRRSQAPAGKAPSVVHVEESDHEGDDHMVEDDVVPLQIDGAESSFRGEGHDSSPASKKRKAEDGQPWGSGDPPFMVISEKDSFKRLTKSMNVLFTPTNDEYFEGIPLEDELDGFHMAWVELSIRAAAMSRRKNHLRKMEVELDDLRRQKEELSNKKKEQEEELKGELSAAQAKSKELEDGQASTESYIEAWKKSEAGVAYLASVGQQCLTVEEESALDKMRKLFARMLPSADFAAFEKDYHAMKLAEEEALMSDMLREAQEGLAKEDEAGAATESVTAEAGGPATEPSSRVVSSQGPSTLASEDGPKKVRSSRANTYHVLKGGALPSDDSSSSSSSE
ncbi:hypothetical protein SOVF_167070, partial [Spinacia oleracea]